MSMMQLIKRIKETHSLQSAFSSLASLIFGSRPELQEKGDDYRRPLSKRPQAGTKDEQTKQAH